MNHLQSYRLPHHLLGAGLLLALSLGACSKIELGPVAAPIEASATSSVKASNPGVVAGRPAPLSDTKAYLPAPAIKALLTGGSSKTWKLDNNVDAALVVGTEANPTEYYPGAPAGTLPACQVDDEYTFTNNNRMYYDAKAETFLAGTFTCSAPRTDMSIYVFDNAVGAGLAQFTLARPGAFVGATDASVSEQVYRILAIDGTRMVLRAGSGRNGDVVFTFKMVAK